MTTFCQKSIYSEIPEKMRDFLPSSSKTALSGNHYFCKAVHRYDASPRKMPLLIKHFQIDLTASALNRPNSGI